MGLQKKHIFGLRMIKTTRILAAFAFIALIILGLFYVNRLEFKFSFEEFFPTNDPDLDFFNEFIAEFETDDNFYLIAIDREEGIFDDEFLQKVDQLTDTLRTLEPIKNSVSITTLRYPIKTPFAVTSVPAIHLGNQELIDQDAKLLRKDERFVRNLFSENEKSTVINLKIVDGISLENSNQLVTDITNLCEMMNFEDYHMLGRAVFQKEMISMSRHEITKSSALAGVLVLLVLIIIFRKPVPVILSMTAIGLSMMSFVVFLGVTNSSLSAMAGLYPILMIIVSTSDVIHMLSKYIDELKKGKPKREATIIMIKDIGLATLLTSITTAIGFGSLLFSRLTPIRDFGINASIGVMLAFFVIVSFSAVAFSLFDLSYFEKNKNGKSFWEPKLLRINEQTKNNKLQLRILFVVLMIVCAFGISKITTNYTLVNNLPRNQKITEDYKYFEKIFAGFRPMELAIQTQNDYRVDDYEVMKSIKKIEDYISQFEPVNNVISYTSVYKTIQRMVNGNRIDMYTFPENEQDFNQLNQYVNSIPKSTSAILVNKDKTKSRITSRLDDVGAETIQDIVEEIDAWVEQNIDPEVISVKITGTAMLLDKNTFYVRESLLKGLGVAVLIVAIIMVLLFRNLKMLLISMIPNIVPLIVSAALIGYAGIELEAGLSIVFAIAFGIAVDDTIHFLSKYKIERSKGLRIEEALEVTFRETGKAIVLTTIILFFGFMVMFFSFHPPSRSIGMLISATLISALIADLYIIPGLIRTFFKGELEKEEAEVENLEI